MHPSAHHEAPTPRDTASLAPKVSEVYAAFSALVSLAKERFKGQLGGKLLLYGQLDSRGAAVALAANIAGAATLGVDSDSDHLKAGIRYGFCDFVVNRFDEALRILKNEVRKKQPVSVCLDGDLAAVLIEAIERGFQPDILALSKQSSAVENLIARGAVVFDQGGAAETQSQEVIWTAESAAALWLPKVDLLAAQILPAGDERLRWLKLAPRYLGRLMADQHYLQMSTAEEEQFATVLAQAVDSGAIGSKITITRRQL